MILRELYDFGNTLQELGKIDILPHHKHRSVVGRVFLSSTGEFSGASVIETDDYTTRCQVTTMAPTSGAAPDLCTPRIDYLMLDARRAATISLVNEFNSIYRIPEIDAYFKWIGCEGGIDGLNTIISMLCESVKLDVDTFIDAMNGNGIESAKVKQVKSAYLEIYVDSICINQMSHVCNSWIEFRDSTNRGDIIIDPVTDIPGERCTSIRVFPGSMSKLMSMTSNTYETPNVNITTTTESYVSAALHFMAQSRKHSTKVCGIEVYYWVNSPCATNDVIDDPSLDLLESCIGGDADNAEAQVAAMKSVLRGDTSWHHTIGTNMNVVTFNVKQGRVGIQSHIKSSDYGTALLDYVNCTSGVRLSYDKANKQFVTAKFVPSMKVIASVYKNIQSKFDRYSLVGDVMASMFYGTPIGKLIVDTITRRIIHGLLVDDILDRKHPEIKDGLWVLDAIYNNHCRNNGVSMENKMKQSQSYLYGEWFAVQCNLAYHAGFDDPNPIRCMLNTMLTNHRDAIGRIEMKADHYIKLISRKSKGLAISRSKMVTDIQTAIAEIASNEGLVNKLVGAEFVLGYYHRFTELITTTAESTESDI